VYEQDTKEYFMTPADFVRSIVPFTEAHLLNRANGMNDIQKKKLDEAYHKIQEFADSNGDGLISFQEYLFFLEILSIPETMFEMAFKIFDKDGNGSLDGAEFAQVVESHKTKVNMRMGLQEQPNYSKNGEYSGFMAKLFGPTGDNSVTFQQFYKSIKGLNDAILMCEYYSMPVDEKGRIDMKSFACSLLTYCPEGDSAHFAQRLESFPASINEKITFDQFKLFIEKIATNFNSIQVAMQLLDEVGHSGKGGVGKDNFVNAIKVATSLTLTKGQVDTIYYIFDRNQDGNLDAVEFSDAIKGRKQRSLDYSLHRGFAAKVMQLWRCATKEQ
jgi:Ca2+-binding EF-hand superfamily protein